MSKEILAVTEKDKDIIAAWYERAKDKEESVDDFIKALNDNYKHDYGTICHAVTAAAIKAAWSMNNQQQGGITGFQAGAVMWEFIRRWNYMEGPMRLMQYDDMLYPQYANKFDKVIDKSTFKHLQDRAEELLKKENYERLKYPDTYCSPNPRVLAHWQSIIDGVVPFGYTVKDD